MANFAWKFEFFLNCLKNQILGKICLRIEFVLVQLLKETDIFRKFAWTNRNFLVKLPEKIEIFGPESTNPQISNQIDAADSGKLLHIMGTKHYGSIHI